MQEQRKPRGKPRVPDHLRPIIVTARLPRDVVAWMDARGPSRAAVIMQLIRAERGAK